MQVNFHRESPSSSSSRLDRQHSYFSPVRPSVATTLQPTTMNGFSLSLSSAITMSASLSFALSLVVGEIERNGSTDVEINYSSLKVRCQFRAREREREREVERAIRRWQRWWAPLHLIPHLKDCLPSLPSLLPIFVLDDREWQKSCILLKNTRKYTLPPWNPENKQTWQKPSFHSLRKSADIC